MKYHTHDCEEITGSWKEKSAESAEVLFLRQFFFFFYKMNNLNLK